MLAVLVLLVNVPMSMAQGTQDPLTKAGGLSGIDAIRSYGDDTIGGWSRGTAGGAYDITGTNKASGLTGSFGNLLGDNSVGTDTASSQSQSLVESFSKGIRGSILNLSVSGSSQAVDWAGIIKNDNEYVMGINNLKSTYTGTLTADSPASLRGSALTYGQTDVSRDDLSTLGSIQGVANARITNRGGDPSSSVTITGSGALGAASYYASPDGTTLAASWTDGRTEFSGTSDKAITGKLSGYEQTIINPERRSCSHCQRIEGHDGHSGAQLRI